MEGNYGINALGAEERDAFQASLSVVRQGGNDQDFQRCAVFGESSGGLLKQFGFNKAKNLRGACQPRRTEGFRVPAFDDDDGALDRGQILRSEDERQHLPPRLRMRVENEEVYGVVVLATRLIDVFAVLAYQEFVQLEVLADDGFANGGHLFS